MDIEKTLSELKFYINDILKCSAAMLEISRIISSNLDDLNNFSLSDLQKLKTLKNSISLDYDFITFDYLLCLKFNDLNSKYPSNLERKK